MLSIIIPCFNDRKILKKLLETVNASPIPGEQIVLKIVS